MPSWAWIKPHDVGGFFRHGGFGRGIEIGKASGIDHWFHLDVRMTEQGHAEGRIEKDIGVLLTCDAVRGQGMEEVLNFLVSTRKAHPDLTVSQVLQTGGLGAAQKLMEVEWLVVLLQELVKEVVIGRIAGPLKFQA